MVGGGIRNIGSLVIRNSTIAANIAGYGGGVGNYGGSPDVTFQNSIVVGNRATEAIASADVSLGRDDVSAAIHNLIGDGGGHVMLIDGQDGNLVGTTEDPLDPKFIRVPSPGPDDLWGDRGRRLG